MDVAAAVPLAVAPTHPLPAIALETVLILLALAPWPCPCHSAILVLALMFPAAFVEAPDAAAIVAPPAAGDDDVGLDRASHLCAEGLHVSEEVDK